MPGGGAVAARSPHSHDAGDNRDEEGMHNGKVCIFIFIYIKVFNCHPQDCAYEGQRSFTDFLRMTRLKYLAVCGPGKPGGLQVTLLRDQNLLTEGGGGTPYNASV